MESVLADSWPAAETVQIGGWRLGFSSGVTRRANSALPLGSLKDQSAESTVGMVEGHYRKRGLAPCFKMTKAALPRRLSKLLDHRGYNRNGHSHVLVGSLDAAATGMNTSLEIEFLGEPEPTWTSLTWPDEEYPDAPGRRAIIARLPEPHTFALIAKDGLPVGAAAATVVDDWAVICAVRVETEFRRQGIALALMESLRGWSLSQKARGSVLQVETSNLAAQRLYTGIGMRLAYSYHYRTQTGDNDSKRGPHHGP